MSSALAESEKGNGGHPLHRGNDVWLACRGIVSFDLQPSPLTGREMVSSITHDFFGPVKELEVPEDVGGMRVVIAKPCRNVSSSLGIGDIDPDSGFGCLSTAAKTRKIGIMNP